MKRAFTLIELLIVVAIIAILAAIAVPNFLEAQTRSKVSKCKSDMRSISIALESYMVDQNKYPFDKLSCGYPWYLTDVLSTPIAYMSNVPYDLFAVGSRATRATTWNTAAYQFLGKKYRYLNWQANQIGNEWAACWTPAGSYAGKSWSVSPTQTNLDAFNNAFGAWKLQSMGPDQLDDDPSGGFMNGNILVYYDATNGTKSPGDIILSAKGMK